MRWQAEVGRHGIAFRTVLDSEAAYVYVAEDALIEVVGALLTNALKYTPAHGRVGMAVPRDTPGKRVRIAVSDSGIGVAADAGERAQSNQQRAPDRPG